MIKLLAVDMDGTCLNMHHRISEKTMEALHAAADAGIILVPTTGRTATCLPAQLADKPFFRYIISSNGAEALDLCTRKSIFKSLIPNETAISFLNQCEQERLGISAHITHDFCIQGRKLYTLGKICYRGDAKNTKLLKSITDRLMKKREDVEELQIFFFTKRQQASARQIFDANENLIASFSDCYVEIYAKDASKGNALKALAEQLKIPKEQIACIGDAENDLSMFEASGTKFAMGNAIEILKEKADYVLPSNAEDGVAYAINKYLLKRIKR